MSWNNGTNGKGNTSNGNGRELAPVSKSALPEHLPAGAKAFQAAVDGKLTKEVWDEILDSQIAKAKQGDRGAAKFLLEYAGGVASMRGATFVQEHHHHEHYHEATEDARAARSGASGDVPDRSPADYARERTRLAHRVAAGRG